MEAGYALEIADAPLLHRGLTLADLAHLVELVECGALTRAEAILGGQDDPLPPLNELNPEVTKPISDVILRGMSVRQDHRWPNAGDMQKALRRAVNAPKTEAVDAKTMVMDPPAPVAESLPPKTEQLPPSSMPTIDRIHVSAPPAEATVQVAVE